jgi:hypothetical protein
LLAVATWIMASWLAELWDNFAHLAITAPEPRCGKSLLLALLNLLCRWPQYVTSATAASIFRDIGSGNNWQLLPTILLDEAQSLQRRGTESNEVLRELFCGSIARAATVRRCTGPKHTSTAFRT